MLESAKGRRGALRELIDALLVVTRGIHGTSSHQTIVICHGPQNHVQNFATSELIKEQKSFYSQIATKLLDFVPRLLFFFRKELSPQQDR
ncbi:hypothetical protein D3C72_1378570 [compost metagenome]